MAISRDGKIVAAGHHAHTLDGVGPVFPPYRFVDPNSGSGVVEVYHRTEDDGWTLLRAVKPGSRWVQSFGHAVALGDNGHVLAVGAPVDPSSATGINGDPDAPPPPDLGPFRQRGAVWVY
jgi:hypothetical protein